MYFCEYKYMQAGIRIAIVKSLWLWNNFNKKITLRNQEPLSFW